MTRKRIIVAAASPLSRTLIGRLLARLPWVEVAGEAATLAQTLSLLSSARPDIAVLGGSFARSRHFETLRPALIAASCRWIEIAPGTPSARSAGPTLSHGLSDQAAAAALQGLLSAPLDRAPLAAEPPAIPTPDPCPTRSDDPVILMGASTGGVDALLEILADFPADCPPTAIVQHTGRAYSGSLVQLLGHRCPAEVVTPRDGMELRRGMICIAAGGDQHLRLHLGTSLRCLLQAGPAVSGHLPSVDALFLSATAWADRVVAVLLTGMGRDGAVGLAALRQGGARTFGQDEATSLVYGMPRAAWELGAVEQQLPLPRIAEVTLAAARREVIR